MMKISIYAIVPIEGNDEDPPLYIGSTTNLKRRNAEHRKRYNNPNDKAYNKPLYKFIRENEGLDNFIMVELVSEEVNNKQEALKLERTYIKLLKPSLNKQIPGKYLELGQKEYDKQRYQANKEEIKRYNKEYGGGKITCPHCCILFRRDNKAQHQRTKKHQQNIQKQAITE